MTFRDFFSFPPVFSGFPGFFGSFSLIVKTCVFSIHRRIFSITETHLLLKRIFIRIFNRFFPVFLVLINEPEENIKYFVRLTTLTGFPGFTVFPVFPVFPCFLISLISRKLLLKQFYQNKYLVYLLYFE